MSRYHLLVIIAVTVTVACISVAGAVQASQLVSLEELFRSSGIANLTPGNYVMILVGGLLIYLAIARKFEPLLLLPIGFGVILANIPIYINGEVTTMMGEGGFLRFIYDAGVATELFPLLIFVGLGALTDFGPLIANPKTALLGAAAQFGVFVTFFGALVLGFTLQESASIGIIGGADGPTAIYTTISLAPHLLGAVAVAAYSYMALVPLIQPPIMRLLTTQRERKIEMRQLRDVGRKERIAFPLVLLMMCVLFVPSATPIIGALAFGNLLRESKVVERLAKTAQNELINTVTILLAITVGGTMSAQNFLTAQTLGIFAMGLAAFAIGTATGLLLGKLMCWATKGQVNPLIGAAGVSAVPMSARVVQVVGNKYNPRNYLLMHAMGPNVAGVIGTAIAAGVLISMVG